MRWSKDKEVLLRTVLKIIISRVVKVWVVNELEMSKMPIWLNIQRANLVPKSYSFLKCVLSVNY